MMNNPMVTKTRGQRLHSQRGFSLIELMMVVVMIFILMGSAYTYLGSASENARQIEPPRRLNEVFIAAQRYQMTKGTWICPATTSAVDGLGVASTTLPSCGWKPAENDDGSGTPTGAIYYHYYLGGAVLAGTGPECATFPNGITPVQSSDNFVAVASVNLDDDAVCDVWTIDKNGKPNHISDDLND